MLDAKGIKKALECAIGLHDNDMEYEIDCSDCVFESESPCGENCTDGMAKAALALINRYETENERLRTEKNNLIKTYKECALEVVKEFAERLENRIVHNDEIINRDSWHITSEINDLVKEMEHERE